MSAVCPLERDRNKRGKVTEREEEEEEEERVDHLLASGDRRGSVRSEKWRLFWKRLDIQIRLTAAVSVSVSSGAAIQQVTD